MPSEGAWTGRLSPGGGGACLKPGKGLAWFLAQALTLSCLAACPSLAALSASVPHCGLPVLPPPLPWVPCLSCFLNQGPTAFAAGSGSPCPWDALINSWSPWSQNLSSPKEKQKQTTRAGGMVDNKSHCNWGPLRSVLRPLPLGLPALSLAPRATASSPHKAFLDQALAPPPLTNFHCPQHRTRPCHLLH